MSDLISRRALLKKLESMTNDNSEYIRNNSHQFTYKELAYIICNQPTAYDVDKVVAELEGLLWECYTDCGQGYATYKKRLREIVRKGGIDE